MGNLALTTCTRLGGKEARPGVKAPARGNTHTPRLDSSPGGESGSYHLHH